MKTRKLGALTVSEIGFGVIFSREHWRQPGLKPQDGPQGRMQVDAALALVSLDQTRSIVLMARRSSIAL